MMRIGAPTRIIGLAFAILFTPSPAVRAQRFYGLAGGLNYAGPTTFGTQGDEHYTRGFALQASGGRQFGDRLGARLDAFLNHFAVQGSPVAVGVACPRIGPCGQPPGSDGFNNPVGLAALTASALVNLDPPGPVRMYLVAGGGAYYLYQHPTAEGAMRLGVSAGGGFTVRVKARSRIFVEARYHDLFGAPIRPMWLVPLTLGVIF